MGKDEIFPVIKKRVMEHYKPGRVGFSGFDFDAGTVTKDEAIEFAKELEAANPNITAHVDDSDEAAAGFHLIVQSKAVR
jgi:hypothetical protein